MFKIHTSYEPCGDQPAAIKKLVKNYTKGIKEQVLLGVTGSGKTFTMANVIEQMKMPTLILAHNKTLAAQLYYEFKELFPNNAVEYFVSYYDYYQPEAYIPTTDLYIEKDSKINDQIERLRYSATRAIIERDDVIIISSVSCIYGLGSPDTYQCMIRTIRKGEMLSREDLIRHLVLIQYQRNDVDFKRNCFRVKGEIVEVFPPYEDEVAHRIVFWDNEIDMLYSFNPLTGEVIEKFDQITIFPTSHYVAPKKYMDMAYELITQELKDNLATFKKENKLLEAQRLEQRTNFDLEQIQVAGFCKGIENYSRHLDGRVAGDPPSTLIDYFPSKFLFIIDESHQTLPQVRGMSNGDRSRKSTLVEHGFRLPSALDNRPLNFQEFLTKLDHVLYVSATPGDFEIDHSKRQIVEQIIRPTGLLDPTPEIRPAKDQVFDLYGEIKIEIEKGNRILVSVLTKRFAEDLTDYYEEMGLKVKYLHSDIDTIERTIIISDLRQGEFDILIGINLLREGLDIPEVSLVAIMDADKEGFLRNYRSLVQTSGRAARNADGRVIFYADKETDSLKTSIQEMLRRREIQKAYNQKYDITPQSIKKGIHSLMESVSEHDYYTVPKLSKKKRFKNDQEMEKHLYTLQQEMLKAAKAMDFEKASKIRDELKLYMNIEGLVLDL